MLVHYVIHPLNSCRDYLTPTTSEGGECHPLKARSQEAKRFRRSSFSERCCCNFHLCSKLPCAHHFFVRCRQTRTSHPSGSRRKSAPGSCPRNSSVPIGHPSDSSLWFAAMGGPSLYWLVRQAGLLVGAGSSLEIRGGVKS